MSKVLKRRTPRLSRLSKTPYSRGEQDPTPPVEVVHGICPPPGIDNESPRKMLQQLEELVRSGKIPKLPTLAEYGNDIFLFLEAMAIYEKYHGGRFELALRALAEKKERERCKSSSHSSECDDPVYGALSLRRAEGMSPVGSPIGSPQW